jgi:alpha-mannosidase
VPVQELELEHEAFGVFDAEGEVLPAQVSGEHLLFLARGVPGIGYKTFWVHKAPKEGIETALRTESGEERFVLENDAVRAEIDTQSGDLRSVVLLPSGRELLRPEGGNVLQLFGDIPDQWDAWNIGYTGEEWGVETPVRLELIESGPLRIAVRATRKIGDSELTQDYVLTAGSPMVEIRTHADWDESHKMLKTAFHVNADADVATFEIPYGTIDRTTKPETDAEKAKWEVPGQRWVDVTDRSGEFGLTLVNDSKYGYDVKDSTLRMTLLRAPKYPDPEADIGEHEFAYALYPHEGGWREADSYRRGAEYNVPLIPRVMDRQKGKLPSEQRLLWTEADHVVLSAFKAIRVKRARPAFVLRVNEVEGTFGTIRLHFPMPIKSAWTATLMEDRLEELPIIDGTAIDAPITYLGLASVLVIPE